MHFLTDLFLRILQAVPSSHFFRFYHHLVVFFLFSILFLLFWTALVLSLSESPIEALRLFASAIVLDLYALLFRLFYAYS